MTSQLENIGKLAAEYGEVLRKVEERRRCWLEKSRPFLLQHLTMLAQQYALGWKVGHNEVLQNLEAVYLVFDHTPSGIVEQSSFSVVQKMKIGAFLSFSQTRNGQIIVWMSFPFIDGMGEEKPKNETLETIEPEEITGENINRYIIKFLDEVIQWENDARDEIGFVRHSR